MKITMQNRFTRLVPIGVLVAIVALLISAPVMAHHGEEHPLVEPDIVPDNPTCIELGYQFGFKPSSGVPTPGPYLIPGTSEQVIVSHDGTFLTWDTTASNFGIDAVIVKGGNQGANVYVYDPPQEQTYDALLHAPSNTLGGNPAAISHIEFCYDFEPVVEKTVTTSYTRTYNWLIEKTAPDPITLLEGDSSQVEYTIELTQNGYTDSNWKVHSEIVITNPYPQSFTITEVDDSLSGAVICVPSLPVVLAPGGSITCTHTANVPDATGGTNTGTAHYTYSYTYEIGQGNDKQEIIVIVDDEVSDETEYSFENAVITEVDKEVNIEDYLNGAFNEDFGPFTTSQTISYTETFTCAIGEGTHTDVYDNTATIIETEQESSDSTSVNCVQLTVAKTANPTYTRQHFWEILKSATNDFTLLEGDARDAEFDITVNYKNFVDSLHQVTGSVTVTNPAPYDVTVTMSDVIDLVAPDGANIDVTLVCEDLVAEASGGTVDCTYTQVLPNNTNATYSNTATATYENRNFLLNGGSVLSGTTNSESSPTVPFGFGAPTTEIDESVTVQDVLDGGAADIYGPFVAGANPNIPPYVETFTCGTTNQLHSNVATLVGSDTPNLGQVTADVAVTCVQLTVVKDAETSYTRDHAWRIEKSASDDIVLLEGDLQDAEFDIDVFYDGFDDSAHQVTGNITVTNPAPYDVTVTVTDVIKLVNPAGADINVTVVCLDPVAEAGGGTASCTYSSPLPDNTDAEYTNTATATYDNRHFNVDGSLKEVLLTDGTESSLAVPFGFGDPTTELDETVSVMDAFDGNPAEPVGTFNAGANPDIPAYTVAFKCSADEGEYENIATLSSEDSGVLDTATANVEVECVQIAVEKTAQGSFTRTYGWNVIKSAAPDWDLFTGDSGTSDYLVEVERFIEDDTNFNVIGSIEITNPAPYAVEVDVEDAVGATSMTVDCDPGAGVSAIVTVPANSNVVCTYSGTLPDDSDPLAEYNNVATATYDNRYFDVDGNERQEAPNTTESASGEAKFTFSSTPVNETAELHDVLDYADATGLADAPRPVEEDLEGGEKFPYSYTFTCDQHEGTHTNTATLKNAAGDVLAETTAAVTVNCYELEINKTAETTFTRYYDWNIDKILLENAPYLVDGKILFAPGQQDTIVLDYEVVVDIAATSDDDHAVNGQITVTNPNPELDAEILSVSDVISPDNLAVDVQCNFTLPHMLEYGTPLVCTYDSELPDAATRTNTATATRQAYNYASNGDATAAGTTFVNRIVNVVFDLDKPTELWDETVTVTDDKLPGQSFTASVSEAPKTFEYSLSFTPADFECGITNFINTATVTEGDSGESASDSETVIVDKACEEGCTLTPGYWKTHSDRGPAPFDAAWYNDGVPDGIEPDKVKETEPGDMPNILWDGVADGNLGTGVEPIPGVYGPDTYFPAGIETPYEHTVGSGRRRTTTDVTYYFAMWTPPQGNAWFNLANHFAAAHLNIQNGASYTAIQTDFIKAYELLLQYSPSQLAALKGSKGNTTRAEFIRLAGVLGAYNEGDIGPGHCDSNSES